MVTFDPPPHTATGSSSSGSPDDSSEFKLDDVSGETKRMVERPAVAIVACAANCKTHDDSGLSDDDDDALRTGAAEILLGLNPSQTCATSAPNAPTPAAVKRKREPKTNFRQNHQMHERTRFLVLAKGDEALMALAVGYDNKTGEFLKYNGPLLDPNPTAPAEKRQKYNDELSNYKKKTSYKGILPLGGKYLKYRASVNTRHHRINVSLGGTLCLAELAWSHDLIRRLILDKTLALADVEDAGVLKKHAKKIGIGKLNFTEPHELTVAWSKENAARKEAELPELDEERKEMILKEAKDQVSRYYTP